MKLPCAWDKADGLPKWKFTQKGSNTSVDVDAKNVDASSYTITSVSPDDEGKYTCSAENTYGKSMVETEISQVISTLFLGYLSLLP